MGQAIYKEDIREVKEKIQIGDRLPVKIFKDESFTRTHVGSVVVGRVVSKHRNICDICADRDVSQSKAGRSDGKTLYKIMKLN
jgi:hypothetical protein